MNKNKLKLNRYTTDSAKIYVEMIRDACKRAGVDPIEAITETDRYPKLLKQPMIEFAVGWMNGVAEATGASINDLWAQCAPPARTKRAA